MRLAIGVLVALCIPVCAWAAATPATDPTAPDMHINWTPIRTVNVTNDATLRAAMDPANLHCGDRIVALNSFQVTGGNITVPNLAASCVGTGVAALAVSGGSGAHAISGSSGAPGIRNTGDNYVVFAGPNLDSFPLNTRVTSGNEASMPVITTYGVTVGDAIFRAADNAHHFIVAGVILQSAPGTAFSGVIFEPPGSDAATPALHPHHLFVDRAVIRGDPTTGANGGPQFCGNDMGITNSRVYDIFYGRNPASGIPEDHGVLHHCGNRHIDRNNEIQADTIGIFMGESSPVVTGVTPTDAEVTQNWVWKPDWMNPNSILYSVGTANVSGDGKTITLNTGTTSAGWNDGKTYFCVIDSANHCGDAYPNRAQLIDGVPTGTTIHLATANANLSANTLAYKITYYSNKTSAGGSAFKNLFESKQWQRLKVHKNKFENSPSGGQNICISLANLHGTGAIATDIQFTLNWIKNCVGAIYYVSRGAQTTGTAFNGVTTVTAAPITNRLRLTLNGGHGSAVGNSIEMAGWLTMTEANTQATITAIIDPFTFETDIVKTHNPTNPFATIFQGVALTIYNDGTPSSRIYVTKNVWQNMGYSQALGLFAGNGQTDLMALNVNPVLTLAGDAAQSATGSWAGDSLVYDHNSCLDAADGFNNWVVRMFKTTLAGIGGNTYSGAWKTTNFQFTNNLCSITGSNSGGPFPVSFRYSDQTTAETSGTTALNLGSDFATRVVTKNVLWNPSTGHATDESGSLLSPDTGNTVLADRSTIGFTGVTDVSTVSGLSGFALTGGSTYHNAGTDGADIGAPISELISALTGVAP